MISDNRLVNSKRRAEKRSAFRLHFVPTPLLQSLPYPSTGPRAWISKRRNALRFYALRLLLST